MKITGIFVGFPGLGRVVPKVNVNRNQKYSENGNMLYSVFGNITYSIFGNNNTVNSEQK